MGIGPVTAARLIGRSGRPSRFPSSAAFAAYSGVAPVEVASAEHARHRLSRSGDRQLNSALHIVAVTQIRTAGSLGNIYYRTKIAEGKTAREARRCLKRRLADHVWRTMIADEKRQRAKPGFRLRRCLISQTSNSAPPSGGSPDLRQDVEVASFPSA